MFNELNPDNLKNTIVITEQADVQRVLAFAIDLMYEKNYPWIELLSFSNYMSKCVLIGELLKRKIKNISAVNSLTTHLQTSIYKARNPRDTSLKQFKKEKPYTLLSIKLFRHDPKPE